MNRTIDVVVIHSLVSAALPFLINRFGCASKLQACRNDFIGCLERLSIIYMINFLVTCLTDSKLFTTHSCSEVFSGRDALLARAGIRYEHLSCMAHFVDFVEFVFVGSLKTRPKTSFQVANWKGNRTRAISGKSL